MDMPVWLSVGLRMILSIRQFPNWTDWALMAVVHWETFAETAAMLDRDDLVGHLEAWTYRQIEQLKTEFWIVKT